MSLKSWRVGFLLVFSFVRNLVNQNEVILLKFRRKQRDQISENKSCSKTQRPPSPTADQKSPFVFNKMTK